MIVIVLKIKVIHLILTLLFITKVYSLTESVCSPEKDCWFFLSIINYQLRVARHWSYNSYRFVVTNTSPRQEHLDSHLVLLLLNLLPVFALQSSS